MAEANSTAARKTTAPRTHTKRSHNDTERLSASAAAPAAPVATHTDRPRGRLLSLDDQDSIEGLLIDATSIIWVCSHAHDSDCIPSNAVPQSLAAVTSMLGKVIAILDATPELAAEGRSHG